MKRLPVETEDGAEHVRIAESRVQGLWLDGEAYLAAGRPGGAAGVLIDAFGGAFRLTSDVFRPARHAKGPGRREGRGPAVGREEFRVADVGAGRWQGRWTIQ